MALITNLIDARDRPKQPVWKAVGAQMSWASGESGALSHTLNINGVVRRIAIAISANTNNRTATISITDEDGAVPYLSGQNSHTATTVLDITEYVSGQITIEVTPSGDPGSGGMTANFVLHGT